MNFLFFYDNDVVVYGTIFVFFYGNDVVVYRTIFILFYGNIVAVYLTKWGDMLVGLKPVGAEAGVGD